MKCHNCRNGFVDIAQNGEIEHDICMDCNGAGEIKSRDELAAENNTLLAENERLRKEINDRDNEMLEVKFNRFAREESCPKHITELESFPKNLYFAYCPQCGRKNP